MTRPDADLVDPDADVRVPTPQGERRTTPWPVLAAVSAGGVVGALARHGLQQALPLWPGGFGWVTFGINIFGCLLMGVLMVRITEVWTGNRLLAPVPRGRGAGRIHHLLHVRARGPAGHRRGRLAHRPALRDRHPGRRAGRGVARRPDRRAGGPAARPGSGPARGAPPAARVSLLIGERHRGAGR